MKDLLSLAYILRGEVGTHLGDKDAVPLQRRLVLDETQEVTLVLRML